MPTSRKRKRNGPNNGYRNRNRTHNNNNRRRQALSFVARKAINEGYGDDIENPLAEVVYDFPELRNAKLKGRGPQRRTPAMFRAQKGNVTGPFGLNKMSLGYGRVNQKNAVGRTAFAQAIAANQYEAAAHLLGKGADVDAKDRGRSTPLMSECRRGNLAAVRFLIENGADVNARDGLGDPVLFHSFLQIDCLRELLENGADVNGQSTLDGFTGLMRAIRTGRPAVIRVLLENGADVNLVTGGQNALTVTRTLLARMTTTVNNLTQLRAAGGIIDEQLYDRVVRALVSLSEIDDILEAAGAVAVG